MQNQVRLQTNSQTGSAGGVANPGGVVPDPDPDPDPVPDPN